MSDISYSFLRSNLSISPNVQFPNRESTILNDSCPSFKMYMFQGHHEDSGVLMITSFKMYIFQGHHEDSGVIHELLMSDSQVTDE